MKTSQAHLSRRAPGLGRRSFSLMAAASLLTSREAFAADYPDRPLTFIVAYTPGSANDILVRIVAPALGRELGQPIVVDNRPGAGGTLGGALSARAPADGYTLALGSTASVAINRALFKGLNYDPWKDFAAVIDFGSTPNVLAVPGNSGIRSIADLRQAAAAGKLNFSSPGNGTTQHLAGVLLQRTLGLRDTVHVPYKGPAEQVTGLAGQQVDFGFVSLPSSQALIRDGRLRALGLTAAHPATSLPQVPTLTSVGVPGFEQAGVWFGMQVPVRTPQAIAQRLHDASARALADPSVQRKLVDAGYEPAPVGSAADFARFVQAQVAFWQDLVVTSGASVD